MSRLSAILKLTRIEHSIMLVAAVIAAELLVVGLPSPGLLVLSIISPVFVSMGAFAINDFFDMKVDRLNHKDRPLVTGDLRPVNALYITAACFVIGVGASFFINIYAFWIAFVFALLAFLYSMRLKEILLVGNVYIALTMVIPFIFGNYVVSTSLSGTVLVLCAMVFLSGMAREIHGTIRDYSGDVKVRNARTLPRVIGIRRAAWVALLFYLAAIAVSAYLFLYVPPFVLNLVFGAIIFVSDLLFLYVGLGYLYKKRKMQEFYDGSRNVSLLAMGLALISIILTVLVHT